MVTRLFGFSGKVDLVPQAIVNRSVRELSVDLGVELEHASDDLDQFECAYFNVDGKVAAFIHYAGEPDDQVTVYVQRELGSKDVTKTLNKLLKAFALPRDAVVWRETEDLRRDRVTG
jgi:hypothetical protein